MGAVRLDQGLLAKMVKNSKLSLKSVREGISKRADRWQVVPQAAQILWARELGISATRPMQRLDPHVQEQVRTGLPALFAAPAPSSNKGKGQKGKGAKGRKAAASAASGLGAAIDYLLSDDELKRRCADLLTAKGSFDRVFREATTVLDDRLKKLARIKGHIDPANLVAKVLHPNNAILVVSDHTNEQDGMYSIAKGLMLAFRNPAHHSLNDKLTREDALRFCGFIDAMLTLLGQARVNVATNP
jgi:hypothetical protein